MLTKKSATGRSGQVRRSLDRDREEGMLLFAAVMSGKFLWYFLLVDVCQFAATELFNIQSCEDGDSV